MFQHWSLLGSQPPAVDSLQPDLAEVDFAARGGALSGGEEDLRGEPRGNWHVGPQEKCCFFLEKRYRKCGWFDLVIESWISVIQYIYTYIYTHDCDVLGDKILISDSFSKLFLETPNQSDRGIIEGTSTIPRRASEEPLRTGALHRFHWWMPYHSKLLVYGWIPGKKKMWTTSSKVVDWYHFVAGLWTINSSCLMTDLNRSSYLLYVWRMTHTHTIWLSWAYFDVGRNDLCRPSAEF